MIRSIISVIVGYIALAIVVFVIFTAAYLLMGVDRAFQPGSYEVSMTWAIMSVAVNILAAAIGGVVCVAIARSMKPAMVLAGLILVLGLLVAIPVVTADRDDMPARTADVSNMEAMRNAQQPVWFALTTPFIGAAGVMLGAGIGHTTRRAAGQGHQSLP